MNKMYEECAKKCDFGKDKSTKYSDSGNNTKNTETKLSKGLRHISLFTLATALFLFVLLITLSPALAIQDLMSLQGNVNDNGMPIPLGDLSVTIWTQETGGSLVYNSSNDYNDAIVMGRFDIVLGDGAEELVLEYGRIYYMDMVVDGQDMDFNGSERRIFQSNIGNVSNPYISANSINTSQIIDQSITNQKISASAGIDKNKISLTGTWAEADIPSLTNSWSGTLNASKIVSSNILNVNSSIYSQYVGGFDAAAIALKLNTSLFIADNISIWSTLNNKLNVADQRYNDTALISEKLTATAITCAAGNYSRFNGTGFECYSDLESTTTYTATAPGLILTVSSFSLNESYANSKWNDTLLINNLNFSKLNLSDQRFNETSIILSNDTLLNSRINSLNSSVQFNVTSLLSNDTTLNTKIDNLNTSIGSFYTSNNGNSLAVNLSNLNSSVIANDTALSTRINNLNSSLVANDTTLNTKIDNLNTSIGSLYSVGNGNSLAINISNLNSSLLANDTALSTRINNLNSSLQFNVTSLLSNDTTLNTKIDNLNTSIGSFYTSNNGNSLASNLSSLNVSLQFNITSLWSNFASYYSSVNGNSLASNLSSLNSSLLANDTNLNNRIVVLTNDNSTQATAISNLIASNTTLASAINNLATNITNLNSSLVTNDSSLSIRINSLNSSLQFNVTSLLSNDTTLNVKIDNLNSSLIANDTTLNTKINNVNSSGNIQNLGFNTTAQLDTQFLNTDDTINVTNINATNTPSSGRILSYGTNDRFVWADTLITNYTTAAVSTTSNTVYSLIPNLTITLPNASTYVITCHLLTYSAAVTTGERLRINTTGSPSIVTWVYRTQVSATTITPFQGVSTSTNTFADTGSAGTNIRDSGLVQGYIVTAASPSVVTYELISEISASSVVVDRGSYCTYIKVK
ncbi:MAG: beta strand repeat-containing protein [Candidatus Woesearchaeota archaeon]